MTEFKKRTSITFSQILEEEIKFLEKNPNESLTWDCSLASDFVNGIYNKTDEGYLTRKDAFRKVADGVLYRARVSGDHDKVEQINELLKSNDFLVFND